MHRSPPGIQLSCQLSEKKIIDNDRVAGAAKRLKGAAKQALGKAIGDVKLESDGRADEVDGKVQNAVGGLKDAFKLK